MKKIGVLGNGTMGAGIIQVLAQNGYEVVLRARRQTSVDKGIATVEKNLDRLIKNCLLYTSLVVPSSLKAKSLACVPPSFSMKEAVLSLSQEKVSEVCRELKYFSSAPTFLSMAHSLSFRMVM